MAGGDGSLGAVAAVALERDVPFVCIPFGTRNHFARDLGLDRDDPRKTRNRLTAFLRMVPAAVGRARRPLAVSFEIDGRREEHLALVVLVANNDYRMTSMADLGERTRLDEGRLHVYVIQAVDRRRLLGLLGRAVRSRLDAAEGWVEWAVPAFRIVHARQRVRAALDGDPVVLESPLEFEIRPRALRVLVPPGA